VLILEIERLLAASPAKTRNDCRLVTTERHARPFT
jgi:hypothetical protein